MRLTIKLDMDNAAFSDANSGNPELDAMLEVRRCIVRTLERLDSLEWPTHWQNIHDTNGNPTGQFRVSGT